MRILYDDNHILLKGKLGRSGIYDVFEIETQLSEEWCKRLEFINVINNKIILLAQHWVPLRPAV